MSHNEIATDPTLDTGSGEGPGGRDEAAPELNISVDIGRHHVADRLLDGAQRGDDSAPNLGPLPDFPPHDMDNGLPFHDNRLDFASPPRDENPFSDRLNNSGSGREDTDDIWNLAMADDENALDRLLGARVDDEINGIGREDTDDIWDMEIADDEDALDRLLAAQEHDDAAPFLNTSDGSFFDEDEAHKRLLDDLIPRAPPVPADVPGEPRRLTEEELRRFLPEERDLYRLTDFFDEAVHMALPFDPEFDCSCSMDHLTASHEGRRKRCASEPLPGPPKRCCPRIPDLNLLTLNARRPRTNYLPFAPLLDLHNASQASNPAENMKNEANVVSSTRSSTSVPKTSNDNLTTPMDDSMDGIQITARSSSSSVSLSVADLQTARETTPPPPPPVNVAPMVVLAVPAPAPAPMDDSLDGIQNSTRSSSSSISLLATARSVSTISVDDLQTARATTPPPPPINVAQMPVLAVPALVPVPFLNAAVLQRAQILENDIQTALASIAERLKLISSPQYRCSKNTLDFVSRLQRSRTTMRRLQKELNEANLGIGRKTHGQIEAAYETNERKLLKLLTEITRA